MPSERHFVGRKAELQAFRLALEDPVGQAILIAGGQGMGKSFLARRMAEEAEYHPTLRCGVVRYEVAATDSVESVMALMLDHAFAVAPGAEGSFAPSPRSREQWRTLFEAVLPKGGDLVSLYASLHRDPARSSREQLGTALEAVSERMSETSRDGIHLRLPWLDLLCSGRSEGGGAVAPREPGDRGADGTFGADGKRLQ